MLSTIEGVYRYPVDVEFTANLSAEGGIVINLLQCRPLQTKGVTASAAIPGKIPEQYIFISSRRRFMGGNASLPISRVVYIDPLSYYKLQEEQKYAVARLVGELNALGGSALNGAAMLICPGRIGTSTPSLGLPVSFSEVSNFSVLCELSCPEKGMSPDLSFGSHFFQDLVEADIFYLALFMGDKDTRLNEAYIAQGENSLAALVPGGYKFEETVKVVETGGGLTLVSDIETQRLVCFKAKLDNGHNTV